MWVEDYAFSTLEIPNTQGSECLAASYRLHIDSPKKNQHVRAF